MPLTFRLWKEGDPLAEAKWGIKEPLPSAPEVFPDLLFVPLAAYDRSGNRLGYGAGFYDRTLSRLRAMKKIIAVGVAYHVQEMHEIPTDATDEKLDFILTDQEWISLRMSAIENGTSRMRLLFVGDIVGRSGRIALQDELPRLRKAWALDCVVVNGENAAGGFGINEQILQDFFDCGVDCVTLGNHAFDQRETLAFIDDQPRLIRPINYPKGTPGRGASLIETKSGARVLVINAMGRLYMDALDDPFAASAEAIGACPLGEGCDALIVDFHAETTSEKQAFAQFVDGRASLVVGTHTHVPTADHQILPQGTAFITDAGMTGDYDSVIGMEKEEPVRRFTKKTPGQPARARGRPRDALRHRGRDGCRMGLRSKSRRCASAAGFRRRAPIFGIEQ